MSAITNSISVSIVNYNTAHLLQECVTRVIKFVPHLTHIIVINHSAEEISLTPTSVPLCVITQENRGFGAGHNRAFQELSQEVDARHFHLFLNPDALLTEDLTPLLAHFAAPDVAAVGAQLVDSAYNKDFHCAGATPTFWRSLAQKVLSPTLPSTATPVDWVSGGALLVRSKDFLAAGGFDEHYFLYFEDTDLCTRLRTNHGKQIIFDPAVHIVHKSGQSFTCPKEQKYYYDTSQDHYFTTHHSPLHASAQKTFRHIWRKIT